MRCTLADVLTGAECCVGVELQQKQLQQNKEFEGGSFQVSVCRRRWMFQKKKEKWLTKSHNRARPSVLHNAELLFPTFFAEPCRAAGSQSIIRLEKLQFESFFFFFFTSAPDVSSWRTRKRGEIGGATDRMRTKRKGQWVVNHQVWDFCVDSCAEVDFVPRNCGKALILADKFLKKYVKILRFQSQGKRLNTTLFPFSGCETQRFASDLACAATRAVTKCMQIFFSSTTSATR